jgi:hypothetical protein
MSQSVSQSTPQPVPQSTPQPTADRIPAGRIETFIANAFMAAGLPEVDAEALRESLDAVAHELNIGLLD